MPTAGGVIPTANDEIYDFARLERVLAALVEEQRRLRRDNAALRNEVRARALDVRRLEGQLFEANQRRRDVTKSIDELIAQITQLDTQFPSVDQ